MSRKPRADSVLRNMSDEHMDMLRAWLVDDGIGYGEAKARIETEFGLKVSISSIADFWREECIPYRAARATRMADNFRDAMADAPGKLDAVTIGALSQRIFELSLSPDGSAKEMVQLASILGDSKRLAIKQQELALKKNQGDQRLVLQAQALETRNRELEQKIDAFQFDAAKAAMKHAKEIRLVMGDKTIDAGEKLARVRKILFGEMPADFAPVTTPREGGDA